MNRDEGFQRLVGAKIREIRKSRGVSQESFADLCGLHRTHMSLVERGKLNFTLSTLRAILDSLEVKASDFFAGIE